MSTTSILPLINRRVMSVSQTTEAVSKAICGPKCSHVCALSNSYECQALYFSKSLLDASTWHVLTASE
eukprot:11868124-Karenia_brevis.AAC.1